MTLTNGWLKSYRLHGVAIIFTTIGWSGLSTWSAVCFAVRSETGPFPITYEVEPNEYAGQERIFRETKN
jgi:hypothetical protein